MVKLFHLLLVVLILITSLSACGGNSGAVPVRSGEEVVQSNTGTNQVEDLPPDESASPPGDDEDVVDTPSIPAGPATIEDFTTQLELTPYYTEEGFDLDAVAEYFGFTKGPEKPDDGHITYLRQVDGITCSAQYHSTGPYPIGASCAEDYSEKGAALWRVEPDALTGIQDPTETVRIKNYDFSIPKGLEIVLSYILENSAHVDPAPFPSNFDLITVYPNQTNQ